MIIIVDVKWLSFLFSILKSWIHWHWMKKALVIAALDLLHQLMPTLCDWRDFRLLLSTIEHCAGVGSKKCSTHFSLIETIRNYIVATAYHRWSERKSFIQLKTNYKIPCATAATQSHTLNVTIQHFNEHCTRYAFSQTTPTSILVGMLCECWESQRKEEEEEQESREQQ